MIGTRVSWTVAAAPAFATLSPGLRLDLPRQAAPARPKVIGAELCQLITDWNGKRWPACGTALVEQKHDGLRAVWFNGEIVTRNEAPMPCAAHAIPALRDLQATFGVPMMFDAEYIEAGGFEATKRAHETGGASRPPEHPPGLLMIFDAIPMSVWRGIEPCAPLVERKEALRLAMARAPSPYLRYVAHVTATTPADVERIAALAIDAGHEGIVIKDPRAAYERQRSASWQRIKRKAVYDCPIVDVEPVPHAQGTMAALIVEHAGRRVRITIGLTPDERRELWTFWPRLIGRMIEVEAMEETAAGSLRQPRFSRWKDRA